MLSYDAIYQAVVNFTWLCLWLIGIIAAAGVTTRWILRRAGL